MAKRETAEKVVGQPFEVLGFVTDKGYYYRLVSGPYLTRELAQDLAAVASSNGFAGAWHWSEQDAATSDGLAAEFSSDIYEVDSQPANDSRAAPQEPATEGAKRGVVEEAPQDYQLHKLQRDASHHAPAVPAIPEGLMGFVPDVLRHNRLCYTVLPELLHPASLHFLT